MEAGRLFPCVFCIFLLVTATSLAAPPEQPSAPTPKADLGLGASGGPRVYSSSGNTTWLRVHSDSSHCPGDPGGGRGGEATGGPGPMETWCFENGPGDSCGTYPPWDTRCFSHVDVRTEPSHTGINFWHIDSHRTDQRDYCGDYALWCGSDPLWDGKPVECGTWYTPPGYGNWWHCIVQLSLPQDFGVAEGCTLLFDPRYDLECLCDYLYLEFWDGSGWERLAIFNATSDNPGSGCDGPDYWGNSTLDRLTNCNWQERFDPDLPAFYRVITPDTLGVSQGPRFRWRFLSDAEYSDGDHLLNTDGGAFIDNVRVWGDTTRYMEDFEDGILDTAYWSLPDHEGVIDLWHISLDPDPPDEPVICTVDSSYLYRARPEGGYQSGQPWRNGWAYRLMTPAVPMLDTGCKVQFDLHCYSNEMTCDHRDIKVRFYDSGYGTWCPWEEPWWRIISTPCWGIISYLFTNYTETLSWYAPANAESVQFAWELFDYAEPRDICYGKHGGTEMLVDNVSIGFFDADATELSARPRDLFCDTFFAGDSSICGYNAYFDTYNDAEIEAHRVGGGNQPLPTDEQLVIDAYDPDGLSSIDLIATIDEGTSWISKPLAPNDGYYGTVCPSDFGLTGWERGTRVWYYVKTVDELANEAFLPATADPDHPDHTGTIDDYFEFAVLPLYPETYSGPRILMVDDFNRDTYDWAQCLGDIDTYTDLEDIYEQTLTDAGYCFDRYDATGYSRNDPIWFAGYYDALVWFTGTDDSELLTAEAQAYIRDYLGSGGKLVLCSDRLVWDLVYFGNDALGGDFLGGIMGANFLEEMPGGYDYPYVEAVAVESLTVMGEPTPLDLDTLLVFRECPYPKDMTYVLTNGSPPAGYTAQPLLEIANPTIGAADAAVYTEYLGTGQCVFVDFDLAACVNHTSGYCTGNTHPAAPDFGAGYYEGRVELLRTILEDIFGLPSSGSGGPAGIVEPAPGFQWALAQSVPNPSTGPSEIRFEVARRGRVRLTVYNAMGQRVRVLLDEAMPPGNYNATWNGRTASGQQAAAGIYFYRLEAAGFEATRKLLILR